MVLYQLNFSHSSLLCAIRQLSSIISEHLFRPDFLGFDEQALLGFPLLPHNRSRVDVRYERTDLESESGVQVESIISSCMILAKSPVSVALNFLHVKRAIVFTL